MSYIIQSQYAQPTAIYPQAGYMPRGYTNNMQSYGYAYAQGPTNYYPQSYPNSAYYLNSAPTQVVPYTIASNGMPYYNPYMRGQYGGFPRRSSFARRLFGPRPWRRVHWAPNTYHGFRNDSGRFGLAWGSMYGARPGTPMPSASYAPVMYPQSYYPPTSSVGTIGYYGTQYGEYDEGSDGSISSDD